MSVFTVNEARHQRCVRNPEMNNCYAVECMAWRWEQITTAHPLWANAVRAKAAELDEKPPYAKAARWVADNKASIGMVPTRGYCGLAGEPK